MDCPHIAADAALALNKIYSSLHEMEPEGGLYLIHWSKILMRPGLRHIEQACEALERAIMGANSESMLPYEEKMRGKYSLSCHCLSLHRQIQVSIGPHDCLE